MLDSLQEKEPSGYCIIVTEHNNRSKRMAKRDRVSGKLRGAISNRMQVLNPVTKRYVKIDTSRGRIVEHKKSPGPYKNIRTK